MLAHAQELVYSLKELMPTQYQKDNLETMLALFLEVYLVIGKWRIPWNFRVWRGKGTPSPAQLGLSLVKRLPLSLTQHFQTIILADTAFGSVEFLEGIRQLKYHAVTGVAIIVKGKSSAIEMHKMSESLQ